MPLRCRQLAAALLTLGMIAVATKARQAPPTTAHTFRIVLGLSDKTPTDWGGAVAVQNGVIDKLTGWRFEGKDKLDGRTSWTCRTQDHIAPEARNPLQPATGKAPPAAETPWPKGIVFTVNGESPLVTVRLPLGEVRFAASDVALGEPKRFLDGRVSVERLPNFHRLRSPAPPNEIDAVQDDYPAFWVRYRTGKHYLAWIAYQREKDRVMLSERNGPTGEWSEPTVVADAGDHFRVALANLHDDTIWIVWSSQREGKWNLFGRPYKDGKLGDEVQVSNTTGPNIWHRMTTDRNGRAWVVWQGFHNGQSDIFARCVDDKGWHEVIAVSTSGANDWNPTIAGDARDDRVWIAWDTYETGNYSIRVRHLTGGPKPKLSEIMNPQETPRFAAHASLACDRAGNVWLAWDESGANWGKDSGYLYTKNAGTKLYASRQIRVKCYSNGCWLAPAGGDIARMMPAELREFNELPQLQEDSDGRIWLAFRNRVCRRPRVDGWAIQAGWEVYATAFLGDRWLPPVPLENSMGRNDMRVSSQRDRDGNVYFAYASDNRAWLPPAMPPRNLSIAVSQLRAAAPVQSPRLADQQSQRASTPIHPREKQQVERIRAYKVDTGGAVYRIYRGDLHRHTDISTDGAGDGSLMDLHRYALDAAAMDFVLVADHNMGNNNEYCWWRTQKANDIYTVPNAFISMYGYERSVPYPNGHRNVIWAERGHRTLPLPQPAIPAQMASDTGKLYANLRQTRGICTLHTSATGQGTDWKDQVDSELEPIVELFQGFHASYEAPGAPRIVDANSDIVHTSFKPDGYVSIALDRGNRLGFQASSDHVSAHVSYTCVLAEELSRKGLVEAIRKRHTYAATDNIVLDFRLGSLGVMGDEVRTSQVNFDTVAIGTATIERVDLIRNGKVVHTERPDKNATEVRFAWRDPAPVKGKKPAYYYVRVLQADGQMAWASPIWVHSAN